MLRTQSNAHRRATDLSGLWTFRAESASDDASGWSGGVPTGELIAVPGSWNEQLPELRDFCGLAWYETPFFVQPDEDLRQILRFGSVNYAADVWLNGTHVVHHEGGHLPFDIDVTDTCRAGENRLVVRVDNELSMERVPPGKPRGAATGMFAGAGDLTSLLGAMLGTFPDLHADFSPFGGIHRPVVHATVHRRGLTSVRLLETDPHSGVLRAEVEAPEIEAAEIEAAEVETPKLSPTSQAPETEADEATEAAPVHQPAPVAAARVTEPSAAGSAAAAAAPKRVATRIQSAAKAAKADRAAKRAAKAGRAG